MPLPTPARNENDYATGRRVNRNNVLCDGAMQSILASIDESVRAILPDYCS